MHYPGGSREELDLARDRVLLGDYDIHAPQSIVAAVEHVNIREALHPDMQLFARSQHPLQPCLELRTRDPVGGNVLEFVWRQGDGVALNDVARVAREVGREMDRR